MGKERISLSSDNTKSIYLENFHIKHGGKLINFSNYMMPIYYKSGIVNEHIHVRKLVGIFDVSHMGQIIIPKTKKNINSLEKYIPLSLGKLSVNKSYYSFILNEKGGIIDDIIISVIDLNDNQYLYVVYNSARKDVDEKIFKSILEKYTILNSNSLLAIQGPNSKDILDYLNIDYPISFMNNITLKHLQETIIISRTGYTGEDGFEISIPNSIVDKFINKLIKFKDIKLCGLGCRDSLRLEAGLSLYGNDLNEHITPIEAKLKWAIDKNRMKDDSLNGYKILNEQINSGVKKIKVGLKLLSKSIIRSNMKLFDSKQNEIGFISSGGFSPTLKKSIGLGYINYDYDEDSLYCSIRKTIENISIVKLPFVPHKYKRGG